MTERREHLERVLRELAERGVPETTDPWPAIRERVGQRAAAKRRRFWRPRLGVPRTRAGWAFATLLVMLFTTGAYAGSKWVYEVFQSELPGGEAAELGEKLYLTQTMDGARVTVEWAYADTKQVVIGYSVEDLKDDRRDYENDAELRPILATGPSSALPPHSVDITDGSGADFRAVDGTTFVSDPPFILGGPVANTAVFAAPENLEPSEKHRFRFEVPLEEAPIFPPGANRVQDEPDPIIGPFVFDFEIPVHPVRVVEMDREVEASGLTLTLDRVVQSPGRPQAIICFEPPDDAHLWMPKMKTGFLPPEGYLESRPVNGEKSGCWSVALPEYAKSYSFTVEELEGRPPDGEAPWKTIRGPWRFDFEVPDP